MGTLFENPLAQYARHWIYLDKERTHEVHVEVIPDAQGGRVVTTEFAHGSKDPADAVSVETPIDSAWEIDVERARIERRLARLGPYFRRMVGEPQWHPLPTRTHTAPQGHSVSMPGATDPNVTLGIHHFHDSKSRKDRMLLSVPRLDLSQPRFILADLAYVFPEVDRGELTIAHTRLAAAMLRSAISRTDADLSERGFRRLATPLDYATAYGPDWRQSIPATIHALTNRVLEGRTGPGDAPKDNAPTPRLDINEARSLLHDATFNRLKRYLNQDERALWVQGEIGIRRFVSSRRKTTTISEQHELSALEAYLLVGYGFHSGNAELIGVEGAKLARWAAHRACTTQLGGLPSARS